jgi:hypothetical protein
VPATNSCTLLTIANDNHVLVPLLNLLEDKSEHSFGKIIWNIVTLRVDL